MFYEGVKRIIDIIGTVVAILVFGPVMVLIVLYIFLVSPGPIFADIPDRVGRKGGRFRMYKFRSMIPNAHQYLLNNKDLYEQYRKNSYKLLDDPRIIRGGKFVRKYSLDELPQLFNVLKGEMSLVGPRAYFPFELKDQQEAYPESRAYVKKLLEVKPGITGPWQVGGRSEINFLQRAKMDAEYAKRSSILYDFYIIAKTPGAMISGRGAS